ncbi:MAG TPA: FHA domain-containing protein, partial [Polyangiaceae bacterium]|nr:FHA domain-containing protein [Polyangiaceae bacterium]
MAFRSGELTVGRVQGNEVVLPKGNVSKKHARILYREGRFIVTDLNSTNGTYVNRQRIAQATIVRDEDTILIGDFTLRVEVSAGEGPPSDPLTPRREFDAPVPTMTPAPEVTLQHSLTHHSSHPGWERVTANEEAVARSSSGPPGRNTEPPQPELSNVSQRFADLSANHRRAVAQVILLLRERRGAPPAQPDDRDSRDVAALASQIIDQLLVDGLVLTGTSAEAVVQQVQDEWLDVGPLRELLRDPAVSSIAISRFDELIETRDGRQQVCPPGFSSAESLELALERLAARSGAPLGTETIVERVLGGGVRMAVLRGAMAPDGPLGVLEKPRRIKSSLDDLVRRGAISRTMATFLGQCVQARVNMLVIGPRDEGLQIVLGALATAARERVVAISDFDEFAGDSETMVRLDPTVLQGDTRRLFDVASSIPQARLLVTLSSPGLAAAALEALGGGLSGVFCSLRASSLNRGLLRLPADLASERPRIALEVATAWVQSSFELVIEVARLRDGRIRVLRVAEM